MNTTNRTKQAIRNMARIRDISQGFTYLHVILLVQSLISGLAVGFVVMVMAAENYVMVMAGYAVGICLALLVYVWLVKILTNIIANLVRLTSQPVSVRDRSGRFVPISAAANRQKKTFVEV